MMMVIGEGVVPFDLVYLHTEWTIVSVLKRRRERGSSQIDTRLSCLAPGTTFPILNGHNIIGR